MANTRTNWILVVHNTEADGSHIYKLENKTPKEVKGIIVREVKKDKNNDKDAWEYGTTKLADVYETHERNITKLYGEGVYSEYNISR